MDDFEGKHYLPSSLGIIPSLVYNAFNDQNDLTWLYSEMLSEQLNMMKSDEDYNTSADIRSMNSLAKTLSQIAKDSKDKEQIEQARITIEKAPDSDTKKSLLSSLK